MQKPPASADAGGRERKYYGCICKESAQRWMRLEPPGSLRQGKAESTRYME